MWRMPVLMPSTRSTLVALVNLVNIIVIMLNFGML